MSSQHDIDRMRRLAELLMQAQAPKGSMAGRFYVAPSPLAQVTAGLSNVAGGWIDRKADTKQQLYDDGRKKELAEALMKLSGGGGADASPESSAALSAMNNLPLDQQQNAVAEMSMRRLMPKQQSLIKVGRNDSLYDPASQKFVHEAVPTSETETVNFSDAQGNVRLTALKGSPEWRSAINDPNLFATGPVSQRQRIEQGGPGSFDGRTTSQFGDDVKVFQDQSIAATQSIRTSADLLKIARENPAALGTPGGIARFGNNAIQTAKALGAMMGVDIGQPPNFETFDYGAFRNTAIDSTEMRSGIFNIAFAAAVAEQGTRPTDKDIQAFIDQIAGSTSDPVAFARTIQTFNERLSRRIRTTARIKGIPEGVRSLVFQELDAALGETKTYSDSADPTQIPGYDELTPEEQAELAELLRMRNGY